MKYKGKELKEITTPQVFDPPKQMFVWEDVADCKAPYVRTVSAVIRTINGTTQVVGDCSLRWQHCAEIPEEPKPRRATNLEVAKWCATGKGLCKIKNNDDKPENDYVSIYYEYRQKDENKPAYGTCLIRKWEDTDWHEPTVDYIGIEDTKLCGKMLYFTEPDYFKKTEIKIGNQVWMNKNLDISDGGEGIYFNEDNGEYYYNWKAAKRVAAQIHGWHLPSRKEWNELVKYTGNDAANLRDKSWEGTDMYGFSAVPAGTWYNRFSNVDSGARFWTSEPDGSLAWYRLIDTGTSVLEDNSNQYRGFSVRLVKDK